MQRARFRNLIVSFVLLLALATAAFPALAQDVTHVVQPGENLFRIALQYGVDMDTLAQTNGLYNVWTIYAGQTLIIPGAAPVAPVVDIAAPAVVNNAPMYHTVQRGENLASIASQYGLTPDNLALSNNITNPNLIYSGQQLLIPGVAGVEVAAAAPVESAPVPAPEAAPQATYVVQPGEHLASIAAQFGVNWTVLAQANNLIDPNRLFAGQTLIIPAAGAYSATAAYVPAAPPAAVATGRSIVVDLSDSRIYAYENGVLVRNVLASTGLPATPTVQGDYNVYVKYVSTVMSGPGYYLPDVPYTMYFYEGYGIHGTYWHNNFGVPMSHGCVNLPTPEAEWFFNFASVGTPVRVQA